MFEALVYIACCNIDDFVLVHTMVPSFTRTTRTQTGPHILLIFHITFT